ncbi:MAG: dihydroxy-acid dehydratase [Gracilibacteraceae bacterium]|nr:dihydroxy-acid dehydratase [Gracilibacteraceae bacterium]
MNKDENVLHPCRVYKGCGFDDDDLSRPIIGIANAFSDIVPGHFHLRQVADFVKKGVYRAGGNAVEFGVIGCCDSVGNGSFDGMHYILPSREIIADSIEIMAKAHKLDGLVMLGSCDKIIPGMLMGCIRANIPAILVPGGPMLSGPPFGKKVKSDSTAISEAFGMYQVGKAEWKDVKNLELVTQPTCGSCNFYGTANTMSCAAEALGMVLPDGGAIPAVYNERMRCAKRSGEKIMELVERNIRPSDIVTMKSIQNTISYLMATGGSTNAVLHLCAVAYEMGIDTDLIMQEFDRQSTQIPHIARINPASNIYDMEDFYKSGGVPRVMEYLKDHINLDVMTVTGKTLGENINQHSYLYSDCNDEVIRPFDRPFDTLGGLAIMRGNLAPDTGVAKPAAIAEEVRRFTGNAICFDSEEDCEKALMELKIKPGHVVVIRYEGPKGGPGMREMYRPLKLMNGQGLALTTALITDGRFSGTNNGCFVGHISPEAAEGGPIALVRDGDKITIDVYKKELTLHVSDEELACRRAQWSYTPKKLTGYLARYAAMARSADKGGVLDWRK